MKFLSTYAFFLRDQKVKQNLRSLIKYLVFLLAVIIIYSITFHLIMEYVEDRRHSWITGFYWTLTVMSTLGFGDITFASDIGRVFSVFVLISGIVLLLIVLPFTFISLFYAPWLEARLKLRAPRSVPPETKNHVVICDYDESLVPGLIERLEMHRLPYVVLEPDPARAALLHGEGLSVVAGDIDHTKTYKRVNADQARLILANRDDPTNTNIILTVREISADVPVAALAESENSIDIFKLSGAAHVLPLKQQLGEQLANRINAGPAQAHIIGAFRDLVIAEFSVADTPFAGRTIRQSQLREICGANVVGVWDKARLMPAHPDLVLQELSLPVVVGPQDMLDKLNEFLCIYAANYNPVVIIGGGKVGLAAAQALKRRGVRVTMIEKDYALAGQIGGLPDRLIIGDAAQLEIMMEAGLPEAPSVLLTTNDDAVNLYLSIYCRRLNPDTRIVSRITHERNVASMQRAGADLILSYANLAIESIFSLAQNREVVILGEGVKLHTVQVPETLAGRTLAESQIGAKTGLNVIAVNHPSGDATIPTTATVLESGDTLIMIGDHQSFKNFVEMFKVKP